MEVTNHSNSNKKQGGREKVGARGKVGDDSESTVERRDNFSSNQSHG